MKLAVITDSSAGISEKYKRFDNLHILDIPLTVDEQTYSSKDLSSDVFYDLMATAKDVPKSAQPSLIELEDLLKHLEIQGYTHVLGLFLSAGISGFHDNAFYLQDEFDKMQVRLPETFITSAPLGHMVETALEGAVRNLSFEEILTNFEHQRDTDAAYMLVDSLKWLSKSGRLSNSSAILGTWLDIKPVLTFSTDGKVELFEKVRTVKKSMARLKELLLENSDPKKHKIFVIQVRADEKAQELYDYAIEQGYTDVEIVDFGAVIATHLGLGSVAYGMSLKVF